MNEAHHDPSATAPEPDPTTRSPYSRYGAPAPLAVAAGMTFIEGLLTVLFGVTELVSIDSDRLVMGLTTSVFFLAYGGVLLVCAWGLHTVRVVGARPGAAVPADLLGLAWSFKDGSTLPDRHRHWPWRPPSCWPGCCTPGRSTRWSTRA